MSPIIFISHGLISPDFISHDLVSHFIPFVSLLILNLLSCRSGPVHQCPWYLRTAGGHEAEFVHRSTDKEVCVEKVCDSDCSAYIAT